ncbi:MAG: GGDEF domain-containing protein [Planctomycetota bacterium]
MKSTHRTLTLAARPGNLIRGEQSLVQIYPMDLNRGPISLRLDRFVLGRSDDCDLSISDDAVSRHHAEIRQTDDGVVLIDLDSTNGVLVNSQAVTTKSLQSGDCLQLGSHVFRFLADDDLETQYHATVYSMMTRDGLTGAYNKRYLEETLEREVARCRRHSRPISVIMMDVDHFKAVNDQLGHTIGDLVLQELVLRLQKVLRQDDVLARFGGEEFALILVEANPENTAIVAERCRRAIADTPFQTPAGELRITLSLGVTTPDSQELGTATELIHEADQRLYQAKRAGRNRIVS